MEIIQLCGHCGKPLHGRSDMKYCNDACRNNHNRLKKQEEKTYNHPNTSEILKQLKRNYELLKSCHRAPILDHVLTVDTKDFLARGINTKFCTSTFTDQEQQTWHCIFDRWLPHWRAAGLYTGLS